MSPMLHDFHFTHYESVHERPDQEGYKAGYRDTFGAMEYQGKRTLMIEMRRSRCPDANAEYQYNEEIHQETIPDDEPHFAVTPHLSDQVVDDVGNRENQQPGRHINATQPNQLLPDDIGSNQADCKEQSKNHIRE